MDRKHRVEISYQDPMERIKNFDEVCLGYTREEAILEAKRCLKCKNPKCVLMCPVSIDIPLFISHIENEDFDLAYKVLREYSSLPGVCGRVCPQEDQCESTCILGEKYEPIAIGKLERFAADYGLDNNIEDIEVKESNKKKVAVIGSGPAGISCAGELAKLGFSVKIFEALHRPGGVLVYGIPEFRLPKEDIVDVEIQKLLDLGVEIETNTVVGRTINIEDLFDEGYDAIFIGSGAGSPLFLNIPGENLNGVYSANEYLTRSNLMGAYKKNSQTPIKVGDHVVVVGGGNVAMDAARTARRFGSKVSVLYRRTKDELPAREEEIENAMEEGIEFIYLSRPLEIIGNEGGEVEKIKCIKMKLTDADESGRRTPRDLPDTEFYIDTDMVILALGTNPNPLIPSTTEGLSSDKKMRIIVNEEGKTSLKRVYAGGDNVTGSATVILAMEAGKNAAKEIYKSLMKEEV